MLKVSLAMVGILTVASHSDAQSKKALTAPTFYIAASGQHYKDFPVDVKGASNLPPGSRLSLVLADYVGYKSSLLSEEVTVVLNRDGFFGATLKPLPGRHFMDHMVCEISFNPRSVRQDEAVLKIVGNKGELLGIENNPQVGKNSGENYYLEALVQIP